LTSKFPSEEKFGLISQMRRAAVSVPSTLQKVRPATLKVSLFSSSHMLKVL